MAGLVAARGGVLAPYQPSLEIDMMPRGSSRDFSQAVANGGWLRWTKEGIDGGSVDGAFKMRAEMMLSDVRDVEASTGGDGWTTRKADARTLPDGPAGRRGSRVMIRWAGVAGGGRRGR